eukprot:TRINITY_DN2356_c0_g1_i1.p1 TRINITY_DN2356_c0_g1~~TRINITY_DN2356_c0_g1_i1.p1  ORF type:complete len:631 (+),score=159.49 TRINITY_DN2356_c0_g1_i1:45-1895(+)
MRPASNRNRAVEINDRGGGYYGLVSSGLSYLSNLSFKGKNPSKIGDEETMIWSAFDQCTFSSKNKRELVKCLVCCYRTGFQVWDLTNLESIEEIFSKKNLPAKQAKFLQFPDGERNIIHENHPILLVVPLSSEKEASRNQVLLYSLKTESVVHSFSFPSEVFSIHCSKNFFVIALQDSLQVFNSASLDFIISLPTYPSPVPEQVLALGSRWIAYAGNTKIESVAKPEKGALVKIARDVVKGAYFIGDLASQSASSVMNYFGTEEEIKESEEDLEDDPTTSLREIDDDSFIQPQATPSQLISSSPLASLQIADSVMTTETASDDVSGAVFVFDIVDKVFVSKFYAHTHPLACLSWDKSGSLLATADVEAKSFHIFKFSTNTLSRKQPNVLIKPQFCYTLRRGVTSAGVQDISFSPDSRWVAASSVRGTTHIFAIHPQGGPVSFATHHTATTPNRTEDTPRNHIEYQAVLRIKPAIESAEFSPRSCFLPRHCDRVVPLLALLPGGRLAVYPLTPLQVIVNPGDSSSDSLGFVMSEGRCCLYSVVRHSAWAEVGIEERNNNDVQMVMSPVPEESEIWMPQVELETHAKVKKLWETGRFFFLYPDNNGSPPAKHQRKQME